MKEFERDNPQLVARHRLMGKLAEYLLETQGEHRLSEELEHWANSLKSSAGSAPSQKLNEREAAQERLLRDLVKMLTENDFEGLQDWLTMNEATE